MVMHTCNYKIMNSIQAWATKGDPVPRNQGLRSSAEEGPLAEPALGCGIHSPTNNSRNQTKPRENRRRF